MIYRLKLNAPPVATVPDASPPPRNHQHGLDATERWFAGQIESRYAAVTEAALPLAWSDSVRQLVRVSDA